MPTCVVSLHTHLFTRTASAAVTRLQASERFRHRLGTMQERKNARRHEDDSIRRRAQSLGRLADGWTPRWSPVGGKRPVYKWGVLFRIRRRSAVGGLTLLAKVPSIHMVWLHQLTGLLFYKFLYFYCLCILPFSSVLSQNIGSVMSVLHTSQCMRTSSVCACWFGFVGARPTFSDIVRAHTVR